MVKKRKNKYNNTINQRLHKDFCEICGCTDKESIQWHHIIERTEVFTSNDNFNIGIICSNCHNLFHLGNGKLEIIGVYPATNKYGRKLIFKKNGIPNVPGIEEPYYKPQNPQMKLFLKDGYEKK